MQIINTNIFICQLPLSIQEVIQKVVKVYLEENNIFTYENLENILAERLENLNVDGFKKQFETIIKIIKKYRRY